MEEVSECQGGLGRLHSYSDCITYPERGKSEAALLFIMPGQWVQTEIVLGKLS